MVTLESRSTTTHPAMSFLKEASMLPFNQLSEGNIHFSEVVTKLLQPKVENSSTNLESGSPHPLLSTDLRAL